jgi:hypothetical protein
MIGCYKFHFSFLDESRKSADVDLDVVFSVGGLKTFQDISGLKVGQLYDQINSVVVGLATHENIRLQLASLCQEDGVGEEAQKKAELLTKQFASYESELLATALETIPNVLTFLYSCSSSENQSKYPFDISAWCNGLGISDTYRLVNELCQAISADHQRQYLPEEKTQKKKTKRNSSAPTN